MDNYVSRLLEAIAETERLAHDAARNSFGEPPEYTWATKVRRLQDAGWDEVDVMRLDAHVARHDPFSVLRRCAADRRAVERFRLAETEYHPDAFRVMHETLLDLAEGYGLSDPEGDGHG